MTMQEQSRQTSQIDTGQAVVACCSVVGSTAPIFTTTPTMEAKKGNFSALSSEAK